MTCARTLVWLIALIAFLVPSLASGTAMHPVAPQDQAALSDCPNHAPPPADPCPDKGTAKHAASACCPLMSGEIAVMPSIAPEASSSPVDPPLVALAHRLIGFTFTQDPPPPRV